MPRTRVLFLTFLFISLTASLASASSLQPQIVTSFGGITYNQTAVWLGGGGYVPSDMAFAVGPNQLVQVVNGGFQVFSRSGAPLSGQSDVAFWNAAGIATSATNLGVFDPRVLYDSGSNRFFITEDVNGGTSNQILLAVSNTSNPLDGFKAVAFTATTGLASGFADFPTLGLDQSGLYIGTNNFDNNTGANSTISIFSIPKSDLLAPGGPSLANMTTFLGSNTSSDGIVPNPALDPGGSHGAVLATGPGTGQAVLYTISGSGSSSATASGTLLSGLNDGSVVPPLQPDGSSITTNIDNRYGASPVAVGNLLYAANMFGDGSTDLVHWMIIDLNNDTLLQQGTISDPNYFYTYPSIAADSAGDFVIGFNRSGFTADSSGDMSEFAVGCHYDGTTASCGTPFEELAGQAITYDGRWGDYSATVADPTNPGIFWTAQDVTAADGSWTTQITELTSAPEPSTWLLMSAGVLGLFLWRRRPTSPARSRR